VMPVTFFRPLYQKPKKKLNKEIGEKGSEENQLAFRVKLPSQGSCMLRVTQLLPRQRLDK
jgi:hypothetical protein